jgi:tetratricopeptide (TPR) repeat protein
MASRKRKKRPTASTESPTGAQAVVESAIAAASRPTGLRLWLFRFIALIALPALLFVGLELVLRLVGFGFSPAFYRSVPGRAAVAPNPRYGWRYFPPAVARVPLMHVLVDPKPAGTYRIFVLGSSAAQGFPEPAFGFAHQLEVTLLDAFPQAKFEVVNVAMTAINSHAVFDIARACVRHQPDLFIVYEGNNEVIGPAGPGTVFGGASPTLGLVRLQMWARSTRLGQFLNRIAAVLSGQSGTMTEWKGMEFFLGNQVAADDPRLAKTYAFFDQNLRDICSVAHAAGAQTLLCTVAVNLHDCPPFASKHRPGLTDAEQAEWRRLFELSEQLAEAGDLPGAIHALNAAAGIDDRFADLHYRLGLHHLSNGESGKAREHLQRACDLDTLRFRTDSTLNRIIRDVARSGLPGVELVDVERAFARDADGAASIPGRSLFYEHVHLTFEGHYRIARLLFDRVAQRLAADQRVPTGVAAPSAERVRELTAYDYWVRKGLISLISRPPFTNQLDHGIRLAAANDQLAELAKANTPDGMARRRQALERALQRVPHDLLLGRALATHLTRMDDLPTAAQRMNDVLRDAPIDVPVRVALGGVLLRLRRLDDAAQQSLAVLDSDYPDPETRAGASYNLGLARDEQGRRDDAMRAYRDAIRTWPRHDAAYNNLGLLHQQRGEMDEAVRCFRKVVELNADLDVGHRNLALALAALGELDEAAAELERATQLAPDNPVAHSALGDILLAQDQTDAAIERYTTAVRLAPDSADLHDSLGVALAKAGRFDEAITEFRTALRLNPNHATARAHLQEARRSQSVP